MCTRVLVCSFILVQSVIALDFVNFEFLENAGQGKAAEAKAQDGRVVGGYETSIEEHPYQVSLRYKGRHRCGGAIISEEWVLTAAHCLRAISESLLTVRAGTSTLSGRSEEHEVRQVITHEDYSRRASDFDIALIQLESPLEYSDKVQAIELAPLAESYDDGTKASVTGWGARESNGELSNYLREVSVPLISNEECARLYGKRRITSRMLCAGYVGKGGKDACQGDSGGPLVMDRRLIGIVSWGFGCADPAYPGVYTRVAALRSWITDMTGL